MSNDIKIVVAYHTLNEVFNLKLNYTKNTALLNNEPINLDVKDLCDRILVMVSSWDEVIEDPTIIDGISYFVKIQTNQQQYSYEGKNKFPSNFYSFVNLINEVKSNAKKI